jgi:hypothetical protein
MVKRRTVCPSGLATLLATTGLALALAAPGCGLDDRTLRSADGGPPPPAIVVDNFENPENPRFRPWDYYAYNTTIASVSSNVTSPGFDSNYAINLIWEVTDPPDGQPNYPGVGLGCEPVSYIDLSGYSSLLFAQEYLHTDTSCEAVSVLSVRLGCSQYNAAFTGTVALSPQWTTSTIPLSSFSQSAYPSPTPVAMQDCFKKIDGFDFQAQVDLADGACASGALLLDNVEIR